MKNPQAWLFSCAWVLAAGAPAALTMMGGYGNGNGGDRLRPEKNSSWFVATPHPTYCVLLGENVPISPRRFQETFASVEENWRSYVHEKRLDWFQVPSFQYRETCQPDTNLKIYFGTSDSEGQVESALRDYDHPVAFVHRTHFEAGSGKSRGFMWIHGAPDQIDWALPGRLFGILSHEIGHTLGCEHVDGTIMDEGIEQLLSSRGHGNEDEFFKNIDIERDLVPCPDCSFEWVGSQEFRPRSRLSYELTGRHYSRNFHSILIRNSDSTNSEASWAAGGYYSWELRDETGSSVFPLRFLSRDQPWVYRAEFPASLFKIWTIERQYQEHTFGGTLTGTLNAVSGKKFGFHLTYNQFSRKRHGYPRYASSNGKWVLSVFEPDGGAGAEIVFSSLSPVP